MRPLPPESQFRLCHPALLLRPCHLSDRLGLMVRQDYQCLPCRQLGQFRLCHPSYLGRQYRLFPHLGQLVLKVRLDQK